MTINPFSNIGNTVNIAATSASSRVALTSGGNVMGANVRVYNKGTDVVYINFGDSTVTASTTTGIPIPVGAIEVYSVPPGQTHVAAISDSIGTVYFTTGYGV